MILTGFGDEIDPDPVIQLEVLSAVGATHVEVRSAWNTNVIDLPDARIDEIAEAVQAAGMGVSTVASPVGKVHLDGDPDLELRRLERALVVARRLGAPFVRVFTFYPGPGGVDAARDEVVARFRGYAARAADSGVVLAVENDKGLVGEHPDRLADLFATLDSPAVRLAWDPANFAQAGIRPFDEGYAVLRPYLGYLQVKDAITATREVVVAGAGDGQVAETLGALADDGFDGFVSLEPHAAGGREAGISGPHGFREAARALRRIFDELGIEPE